MIDIIIPVYNAKKTIKKALFSIMLQNMIDDINVYLIDDYSDDTYEEEYQLFKNKIKLHLLRLPKNSGPGYARQYGIEHSHSPFLMFLDSDDVLYDPYAVECLYHAIGDANDIAISQLLQINAEYTYSFYPYTDVLHSKLFRREFIENHDIFFPSFYNAEDLAFNNLCLLYNPKIVYCTHNHSCAYIKRKNSLTMTSDYYSKKHIKCFGESIKWVVQYAEERHINSLEIAKRIVDSFAFLYSYFSSSLEDENMKYVFDLLPLYLQYYHLVPQDEVIPYIQYWSQNIGEKKYLLSFYDFITYCNLRVKEES